jgi:sugar O-acyltransferase (sialic acid O-acetyltransferase NeuD family)
MLKSQPLVIYGAGSFGRCVLQIVLDQNRISPIWKFMGFLVDRDFPAPETIHGFPVLGDASWLDGKSDVKVVIAVGAPAARRRIARHIKDEHRNRFATVIHPRAWLGDNVACGEGTVICAGALINIDAVLGEHVHINLGAVIAHDAILEDFVTVAPSVHVSGHARICEGAELGSGARTLPGMIVGSGAVIGAAALVRENIGDDQVAVGVPARPIKTRVPGWHEL